MSTFKKAVKYKLNGRMAITGPSGCGKTYSALRIAQGLLTDGGRIAVIDSERGSAAKYSDVFDFNVLELSSFEPQKYIEAIKEAANENYQVLIVDSLSHAWFGKGGALEQVDAAASRAKGNSFAGWKEVTPIQNKLVDTILGFPGHIIATMRSKSEYVLEKNETTGKTAPRKIGMAPIQKDGMEFEFDVFGEMDMEHRLIITKTRCPDLLDAAIPLPGEELAKTFLAWLSTGEEKAPESEAECLRWVKSEAAKTVTLEQISELKAQCLNILKGNYWTAETKAVLVARHAQLQQLQAA